MSSCDFIRCIACVSLAAFDEHAKRCFRRLAGSTVNFVGSLSRPSKTLLAFSELLGQFASVETSESRHATARLWTRREVSWRGVSGGSVEEAMDEALSARWRKGTVKCDELARRPRSISTGFVDHDDEDTAAERLRCVEHIAQSTIELHKQAGVYYGEQCEYITLCKHIACVTHLTSDY